MQEILTVLSVLFAVLLTIVAFGALCGLFINKREN